MWCSCTLYECCTSPSPNSGGQSFYGLGGCWCIAVCGPLQWTMQCLDKNTPYLFSTCSGLIFISSCKVEQKLNMWNCSCDRRRSFAKISDCRVVFWPGRHDYHWRCKKKTFLELCVARFLWAALPHSIHMDFMSSIFGYALKKTAFVGTHFDLKWTQVFYENNCTEEREHRKLIAFFWSWRMLFSH